MGDSFLGFACLSLSFSLGSEVKARFLGELAKAKYFLKAVKTNMFV
jgi:hypothetical protein